MSAAFIKLTLFPNKKKKRTTAWNSMTAHTWSGCLGARQLVPPEVWSRNSMKQLMHSTLNASPLKKKTDIAICIHEWYWVRLDQTSKDTIYTPHHIWLHLLVSFVEVDAGRLWLGQSPPLMNSAEYPLGGTSKGFNIFPDPESCLRISKPPPPVSFGSSFRIVDVKSLASPFKEKLTFFSPRPAMASVALSLHDGGLQSSVFAAWLFADINGVHFLFFGALCVGWAFLVAGGRKPKILRCSSNMFVSRLVLFSTAFGGPPLAFSRQLPWPTWFGEGFDCPTVDTADSKVLAHCLRSLWTSCTSLQLSRSAMPWVSRRKPCAPMSCDLWFVLATTSFKICDWLCARSHSEVL